MTYNKSYWTVKPESLFSLSLYLSLLNRIAGEAAIKRVNNSKEKIITNTITFFAQRLQCATFIFFVTPSTLKRTTILVTLNPSSFSKHFIHKQRTIWMSVFSRICFAISSCSRIYFDPIINAPYPELVHTRRVNHSFGCFVSYSYNNT